MVTNLNATYDDGTHRELKDQKGERSWEAAIEDWAAAERALESLESEGKIENGDVDSALAEVREE